MLATHGLDQGPDWALMLLPHLGEHSPLTMLDPAIEKLLSQWHGSERIPLGEHPFAQKLLSHIAPDQAPSGWHERVKRMKIRSALVHGDFAVWNTRQELDATGQPQASLTALDWEWADEHGIAGIDLAHGLRQEAYLVKRLPAKQAVDWMLHQASKAPWTSYLQRAGWSGAAEDWLRLGLLHSHYNAKNPSEELLREMGVEVEREEKF